MKPRKLTGEDYLHLVPAISVELADETVVKFSLRAETALPKTADPDALRRALAKAPARQAFWSAQESRALHQVRRARRESEHYDASAFLMYRKLDGELEPERSSDALINAKVSLDKQANLLKLRLRAAERDYEAIRALSRAVSERTLILRTLTQQHQRTDGH